MQFCKDQMKMMGVGGIGTLSAVNAFKRSDLGNSSSANFLTHDQQQETPRYANESSLGKQNNNLQTMQSDKKMESKLKTMINEWQAQFMQEVLQPTLETQYNKMR